MIAYEAFRADRADEVSRLIRRTYDEFVAPDYPEEGNRHFYTFITPEALIDRFSRSGHFILTAADEGRIVGVIAVRDDNHVALMFVDRDYQERGISRELLKRAEQKIAAETDKRETTVFSSPYAVEIYRSLGFHDVGSLQSRDGITFQPMKHPIQSGAE